MSPAAWVRDAVARTGVDNQFLDMIAEGVDRPQNDAVIALSLKTSP
jgi:hypothetical protein